jgi:hypothetical protein
MGMIWVDNFSQYPLGQLPVGVWSGRSLPTVATQGRNGGQRVTWSQNAMVRGGGGSFWRAAYRIDSGGGVRTWRNAHGELPEGTLSSWHWLVGGSYLGYAYSGVVVTEDGAIHVVRGGGFEGGPNATLAEIVASSQPGVVPIRRGWFLLEVEFVWAILGRVVIRINGINVLTYIGNTKSNEDFCVQILQAAACPLDSDLLWPNRVTELGVGGFTRGAAYMPRTGWTGSIDFIAAFDTDPGDIADMAVADLLPDGDGAVSESDITGTTPAATRWQSVDDALANDGEATTVTFTDTAAPAEDEYTLTAFPFGSATIYGVQQSAIHRVSSPGFATARLGVSDGTNVSYGGPLFSRARTFRWQASPTPEKPSGGAWAVGDLANLRLRVQREV